MVIEAGSQAPAGIDLAMHSPQAVVAHMKADGAICVKTFFERGYGADRNLPVPKLETIREVVKAAHAVGMPVLMHANSAEAQRFALDAAVDIIAHGLWNWDPQDSASTQITPNVRDVLDHVIARQVGWQPTMQVLYGIKDLFNPTFLSNPKMRRVLPSSLIDWYRSSEGQWYVRSMASEGLPPGTDPVQAERIIDARINPVIEHGRLATAYLIEHRGRILFGTDTPSAPTYANPPGLNAWLEMHRLLDAGESPAQIFASATLKNAQALKLDRDIGTVEVGKRANLLLLRQDPTQTIQAYTDIVRVILDGKVLNPDDLSADRSHSVSN